MSAIVIDDLPDIARGAATLGAGGGGNPYVGRLLAKTAMANGPDVALIALASVPDDAFVLPVAMMGAPTIMLEKLPSGNELAIAIDAVTRWTGRQPTHLMPIEAGGINALIPIAAAASTSLPMIDADLMGRAFPELQMVTPTLYGGSASPMAVVDDKGNCLILTAPTNHWAERISRSATIAMGCSSIIALYPMSGREAKDRAVAGTISLSRAIGRLIETARLDGEDVGLTVASHLGGARLFVGKVSEVERETVAGFARSSVVLSGIGTHLGSELRLQAQNEWLVAMLGGKPAASTPDLIITLDAESGEPVTVEEIRFGFRIQVLATPCDRRWRTPAGLELVGPRYFGLDLDFTPIDGIGSGALT